MVKLSNVLSSDKILLKTSDLCGHFDFPDLAFLSGHFQGDGTGTKGRIIWQVWEHEYKLIPELERCLDNVYTYMNWKTQKYPVPTFKESGNNKSEFVNVKSKRMGSSKFQSLDIRKNSIPEFIWTGNRLTIAEYIRGLFITDGNVKQTKKQQCIRFTQINHDYIHNVQKLLLNIGVKSTVQKEFSARMQLLPDGRGSKKEYMCKDAYTFSIGSYEYVKQINKLTNFFSARNKVYREIQYPQKSHPFK